MHVTEIAADRTYDLRRRVLRGGRADADVDFPDDHVPGAFHLGAHDDDGRLVAVATFAPAATPHRPGARTWRLRGMAVEPAAQGTGVGRALLGAAVRRAREEQVEALWADGRDGALGFYLGQGWVVEGDGYVTDTGIPHHTIVLDL